MTNNDDIKKELQREEDEVYGDETISGSSPRPSSDDDVEQGMENVTGQEPARDETIADAVNEEEEERHGLEPQKKEGKKEAPHLE
jgi:hypothetical protein